METKRVIIVIESGWVLFAHEALDGSGRVTNARVIQRWGTKEGLAELAIHGPQPETTLSAVMDGEINTSKVLFRINVCPNAKWPE